MSKKQSIKSETEKEFIVQLESEKFYMVFIEHAAPLFDLTSSNQRRILDKFCTMAEFNTGIVLLTSKMRKELCEELDISITNLSNNIKALIDKELISGSRGTYKLNPNVFWKGSMNMRNEAIKQGATLKITFTMENPHD